MEIETKIVHEGYHPEPPIRAVSPPIYETSTFAFADADHGARLFKKEEQGYIYSRLGNPTIDILAKKLAILESAEEGLVFASGSAAIFSTIITIASKGDSIISDNIIYGGTYAQFVKIISRIGIDINFIDTTNENELTRAIKSNTKLIFIETPANPTLKIIDIEKTAKIAHKYNIPLVVDNTFATPYLQRPIELGADVVIHSMTKYLSGHGDVIGGVVVGKKDMIQKIKFNTANDLGANISPFSAWLVLRGISTLAVRMDKHSSNAMSLAKFLQSHKKVEKVYYPGLETHPGHEIAKKQMSKFGGMLGFDVRGGREAGKIIMNSVKVCTLAVSLGDTHTLIEHPASMTHASYSEEECRKVGINPGFIRLSVGIENIKDIIEDLTNALNKI